LYDNHFGCEFIFIFCNLFAYKHFAGQNYEYFFNRQNFLSTNLAYFLPILSFRLIFA